jgi:hypothetical protein
LMTVEPILWRSLHDFFDSMQQVPSWEAHSRSASQQIPSLLWNPKFHYRVHKSPPLSSILNHMNQVHILTPCFFKVRCGLHSSGSGQGPR